VVVAARWLLRFVAAKLLLELSGCLAVVGARWLLRFVEAKLLLELDGCWS